MKTQSMKIMHPLKNIISFLALTAVLANALILPVSSQSFQVGGNVSSGSDTTCPLGVTGLSALQVGNNIQLSWTPSVSGDVSQVTLFSAQNGGPFDGGTNFAASSNGTTVNGVAMGTLYQFRVRTTDFSNNTCPSNDATVDITPSDGNTGSEGGFGVIGQPGGGVSGNALVCPLPITNLQGTVSGTEMNFTWTKAEGDIVQNQILYVQKENEPMSMGIPLSLFPNSLRVYDLDPCSTYTIRIQTVDAQGRGCPSSVAEITLSTGGTCPVETPDNENSNSGSGNDNGNGAQNSGTGNDNDNGNSGGIPPEYNPLCLLNQYYYQNYCYPSISGDGDGSGFGDGDGGGGALGVLWGLGILGGSGGGSGSGSGGSGGGGAISGGSGGGSGLSGGFGYSYGGLFGGLGSLFGVGRGSGGGGGGYTYYGGSGRPEGWSIGGGSSGGGGGAGTQTCIVRPSQRQALVTNTNQNTTVVAPPVVINVNQNTEPAAPRYETVIRRTVVTKEVPQPPRNICIRITPSFNYCAEFAQPPLLVQEVTEEEIQILIEEPAPVSVPAPIPVVTPTPEQNLGYNTGENVPIVDPVLPEGLEYCPIDPDRPAGWIDPGANTPGGNVNYNMNGWPLPDDPTLQPGQPTNGNSNGFPINDPTCFELNGYEICIPNRTNGNTNGGIGGGSGNTNGTSSRTEICYDNLFGAAMCVISNDPDIINNPPILSPELLRSGCPVPFDIRTAPDRRDFDKDGIADSVDPDDDNDGFLDFFDSFPYDPISNEDFDHDCVPDQKDDDWDNDLIPNDMDVCPKTANPDQKDSDNNGVGDACDTQNQCEVYPVTTETKYGGILPSSVPSAKEVDIRSEILKQIFGLSDDQIDSDKDGLADYWEIKYFGTITATDGTLDSDGDGLIDLEEYYFYTHPLKADSDADGLSDFEELKIYYTDPNAYDTDGDALSDYMEVKVYNTNPLAMDTDGDGFFDGMEVTSGTNPLDPSSRPEDKDGDFVDDNWVRKYFPDDIGPDGLFRSKDGKSLGTRDSDEDGLSDMLEYWYGTNPLNPDTDGDGYLDGEEVIDLRSDPKNAKDPQPDLELRITNWKNGDTSASPRILVRGKAMNPDTRVTVYALDGDKKVIDIGTTMTDAKGKFALLANPLTEGRYYLFAYAFSPTEEILEESDPIQIIIDTMLDLDSPDPRRLGDQVISKTDLLKNLTSVEITDRKPSIAGTTVYGSVVTATFQSLIFSSALVADTPEGDFSIRSPMKLDPGPHKVSLYAENALLGLKSDVLVVPFTVEDSIIAQIFYNNSLLQLTIFLLVLVTLIVAYKVIRRSMRRDYFLEAEIADLEDEAVEYEKFRKDQE